MGGFFFGADTLTPLLISTDIKEEARVALKEMAPHILDYAQTNAPWSDITGAARKGLEVDVSEEEDVVVLTLYHTVDYGLWLEVIQSGKWGIIMPTLEAFATQAMVETHSIETGDTLGGGDE